MHFKSLIFILIGVFSLIGVFISQKLIFLYNFGGEGVNLLPIDLFEFLLFALSVLIVIIIIFSAFLLSKRYKVKISWKKKLYSFIYLIFGFAIVFFLMNKNNSQLIAPISIIYFGILLLFWHRSNSGRLSKFGFIEIILGIIAIFFNNNLLFMAIGFGVIPIIYGIYIFKKT